MTIPAHSPPFTWRIHQIVFPWPPEVSTPWYLRQAAGILTPLPMKSIQVYDPPMCCSTGICGTNIDPDLVNFAAMLAQFQKAGIQIERYNLGQQPGDFALNDAVKDLMIAEGTTVLPLIFWDGQLHLKGRYPSKDERPAWFQAAFPHEEAATL
jgi:hypothetical protein